MNKPLAAKSRILFFIGVVLFVLSGVAMQYVDSPEPSLVSPFASLMGIVGYAFVVWAGRTYAIAKGCDGGWALLGVAFLPALIVLFFLRDHRDHAGSPLRGDSH